MQVRRPRLTPLGAVACAAAVVIGVFVWTRSGANPGDRPPRKQVDDLSLRRRVEAMEREILELRKELAAVRAAGGTGQAAEQASDDASQALRRLVGPGTVTTQSAIRELVSSVVRAGDPIVPDVLAVLESGRDVPFGTRSERGGEKVIYPRLRSALLDALARIGTPTAKEGLLGAVRGSRNALDWKDLLLLYEGDLDPDMCAAIGRVFPEVTRLLVEERGEDWSRLQRGVLRWARAHQVAVPPDNLESLSLRRVELHLQDEGSFGMLIEADPARAWRLAQRLLDGPDPASAYLGLTLNIRPGKVPLARVAAYLEEGGAYLAANKRARVNVYMALPVGLCDAIPSTELRIADGKALVDHLERLLGAEQERTARQILTRSIRLIREDIEREQQG